MDLKDFVKETLVQITEGVKEAQEECKKSGCRINPEYKQEGRRKLYTDDNAPVTEVHFKVGLSSDSTEKNKGGIAVSFATVVLGHSNEHGDSYSSDTSVEFSVPVALPKFK